MNKKEYTVKAIKREDCATYILEIHYAKRWPSISYSFGLFYKDSLCGVVTYGTPFSCTLRKGIAGSEYEKDVIELNRLCLKYNRKNEASFLVGKSLRMLPKNKIIVSFSDTEQHHFGYVYQACNFIYCGLSAKRTDWSIKGMENLHGQTISDKLRGVKNRAKKIREIYGDRFYLRPRPRKHRYIYILGGKKRRKEILQVLKYKIKKYPKPAEG